MKNYLIDIDGTITDDVPNEQAEKMATCRPKPGSVEKINALYDAGNTITFFTSRTRQHHFLVTINWLNEHGYKFHFVLFDKPRGGNYVWIDNLDVTGVKYNEGYWEYGVPASPVTIHVQAIKYPHADKIVYYANPGWHQADSYGETPEQAIGHCMLFLNRIYNECGPIDEPMPAIDKIVINHEPLIMPV